MKIPFKLPIPEGFNSTPIWNGKKFVLDDKLLDVLEYSENFSGWSDDLTLLHEEAVGETHPIDLASQLDAIDQIKKKYPNEETVILEIGCSSGYLIKRMMKEFPTSIIIGADVVKMPLYRLANSCPYLPLMRFDLLKCPLPDNSVDIVVILNVLEHIEDDVGALKNIYRILKPGGRVVIEVPAGPSLYDSYDMQLQHFRRYSLYELCCKLEAIGFKVFRKSHLGAIVFPAFALVKLLNKKFKKNSMSDTVEKSASRTGSSLLMKWAMEFESTFLSKFSLSIGIRALVTAQKLDSY